MIEVKNVSFAYNSDEESKKRIVIDNVSLTVNKGELISVLGHNGSGKSTLVKMFNCINLPAGGSVYVDKMDTKDENLLFDIRSRVGIVFQNPDNQLVATIVEEDVAFGPENLGIPSAEIRKRVDEALAAVGMSEYAKSEPHRLSGGQKQRIAIAGVLAMEPECIIFDESTAMLDPYGRAEVLATVEKLKTKGITVVMITHYMEEALLADDVVAINDGKVALSGTPIEVFSNEKALADAGLCPPQNIELTYRLNEKGMNIPLKTSSAKTAESIYSALDGK